MSSNSTLPGTIPVQDSTLKSKLLTNLVIRTPNKWAKETIACIVILIIALIPVIVFSIQIQKLIESDAEINMRHISLDQDLDDHDEKINAFVNDHDQKINALEYKVSLLVKKIEGVTDSLNHGKTFFVLFNMNS